MHARATEKKRGGSIIPDSISSDWQALNLSDGPLHVHLLVLLVAGQEEHHPGRPPLLELDLGRDQAAPGDDLSPGVSQVYLPLHEGRLAVRTERDGKENILDKTQKVCR